jgi:hypothetical protein
LAAEALALDLTLESVALDELATRLTLSGGGIVPRFVTVRAECAVGALRRLVAGVVVVVVASFGAVVTGTRVVEVEVVVGRVVVREARRLAKGRGGVELDEAVKVKTRTKRRTGLDHITQ